MDLKISDTKGFTVIEIMVVISILLVLTTSVIMVINPERERKKARDSVRLTDMQVLSRAIEEYILDKGNPPDVTDVTRTSNSLPAGNSGSFETSTNGWIDANLSDYMVKLPSDPINTGTSVYTYRRSDNTYEINCVLEYLTSYMAGDGGNDANVYEVGSNLTIL